MSGARQGRLHAGSQRSDDVDCCHAGFGRQWGIVVVLLLNRKRLLIKLKKTLSFAVSCLCHVTQSRARACNYAKECNSVFLELTNFVLWMVVSVIFPGLVKQQKLRNRQAPDSITRVPTPEMCSNAAIPRCFSAFAQIEVNRLSGICSPDTQVRR